ncbi:MAG: GWxTD domain-containing protein [Saprospiraceae bacterium]|nr:GWxTD domain-containing protein [Saprospiraceae bacterium]
MRYRIILSLLTIFTMWFRVNALNIDVNPYSFFADKGYAEIHLRVESGSVQFVELNGIKQASIEFVLMVRDVNGNVSYADKFILNGEITKDQRDLITVKRFYIQPGHYSIYLLATDLHLPENKLELETPFYVLEHWDGSRGLSDPILVADKIKLPEGQESETSRFGYLAEPLPYAYADTMHHVIYFMLEVYLNPADTAETFFVNYTISEKYKDNLNAKVLLSQYKKLERRNFQFLILPLSLKELPSGQYHLTAHLLTKDKQKITSRKHNFFKSNPLADIALLDMETQDQKTFANKIPDEELDYVLKAHVPVVANVQLPTLQTLIKGSSSAKKRKFINQYWTIRAPENPEISFDQYMEVARAVDKEYYSNVGYGFQTHRGYIFLKHGKPNNVLSIDNEPDSPPYEIWYYNKIMTTNQTNVRFLFWNESLAHNDYWLLHSTCYGERNNPAWETQLYDSVPDDKIGNTVDGTEVKKGINRQAKLYFNQF